VPGRHNLQNALAAVAVGLELGLAFDRIAAGLAEFRGAERRFEVRGEPNGVLVVDDYGHHPAEIAAVLAALSIAPPDAPLTIHSDSEYTIKVAQGIYKMKANPDLWELYRILLKRRKNPPVFTWVEGHAGHELNERADELAGLGAWNNDYEAYREWQALQAFEAHNKLPPAELATLRQQVQQLKGFVDNLPPDSSRVSAQEREFITDMAKRLRKNNFIPSPKQLNWLKGLTKKFRVQDQEEARPFQNKPDALWE